MAKMVVEFVLKITLTYGSLIGTLIVMAGIGHLFFSADGGTSVAMVTVGAGLILGRAVADNFGGNKPIAHYEGEYNDKLCK